MSFVESTIFWKYSGSQVDILLWKWYGWHPYGLRFYGVSRKKLDATGLKGGRAWPTLMYSRGQNWHDPPYCVRGGGVYAWPTYLYIMTRCSAWQLRFGLFNYSYLGKFLAFYRAVDRNSALLKNFSTNRVAFTEKLLAGRLFTLTSRTSLANGFWL